MFKLTDSIFDLRASIMELIESIEVKSWGEPYDYSGSSRRINDAIHDAKTSLKMSEQALMSIKPAKLDETNWIDKELNTSSMPWQELILSGSANLSNLEDGGLKSMLSLWATLHKNIEKELEEKDYTPIILKNAFNN